MAFLRKTPRNRAERAAQTGDWLTAARLYEEAGDLHRALEAYEKTSEFERAGEIAERLNRDDVAARLYRKAGERPPGRGAPSQDWERPGRGGGFSRGGFTFSMLLAASSMRGSLGRRRSFTNGFWWRAGRQLGKANQ